MGLRAALSDDGCRRSGSTSRIRAGLDDDSCVAPEIVPGAWVIPPPDGGTPTDAHTARAAVYERARTGYDEDGVAVFEWRLFTVGPVIIRTQRVEADATAGTTVERGTATFSYEGPEHPFETSLVVREDGARFRVTSVAQRATAFTLAVVRVDQQDRPPVAEATP